MDSPASPESESIAPINGARIIIVGIVRNIENSLKRDIERLAAAFPTVSSLEWFLVESGSSDDSLEVLESTKEENLNFQYISIQLDSKFSRTQNMSAARNEYLKYLEKNSNYKNYDYVVVADFNCLNNKVVAAAVLSCWNQQKWDVVTANQSGRYYDIWALRHPFWSPNDCWSELEFRRKYLKFPELALAYSVRSRMIKIPRNSSWIEVDSSFGGLGIYKADLFSLNGRYIGTTSDGSLVCEHVSFHENLKLHGKRIFINPSLINTRTTDHSRRMSCTFTILRILKYPFKFLLAKI
jgi:glycosyltransferase involved in cell wall biosynthesis